MYVGKVPAQTKTLYSTAKHGYSVIYKHRTGEIIIFVFRKDIKLVVMKQSCASQCLHRETQDICYIFQLLHLYKQMCLKSAFSRYKKNISILLQFLVFTNKEPKQIQYLDIPSPIMYEYSLRYHGESVHHPIPDTDYTSVYASEYLFYGLPPDSTEYD